MKEKMDENSKSALIEYRIQRAYETLKEAKVMCREIVLCLLLCSDCPLIEI